MKRIALFQICFLGRQYYKMSMTPFIVCDSLWVPFSKEATGPLGFKVRISISKET